MRSENEADHRYQQLDRHGYHRSLRECDVDRCWTEDGRADESCRDAQACAYEAIAKPAWWNKAIDMGPVIEQGQWGCQPAVLQSCTDRARRH